MYWWLCDEMRFSILAFVRVFVYRHATYYARFYSSSYTHKFVYISHSAIFSSFDVKLSKLIHAIFADLCNVSFWCTHTLIILHIDTLIYANTYGESVYVQLVLSLLLLLFCNSRRRFEHAKKITLGNLFFNFRQ